MKIINGVNSKKRKNYRDLVLRRVKFRCDCCSKVIVENLEAINKFGLQNKCFDF